VRNSRGRRRRRACEGIRATKGQLKGGRLKSLKMEGKKGGDLEGRAGVLFRVGRAREKIKKKGGGRGIKRRRDVTG